MPAIVAWAIVTTGTIGPVPVRSVVVSVLVASTEVRLPPIVVLSLIAAVVAAQAPSRVLPAKLKALLIVSLVSVLLVSVPVVSIPISVVVGKEQCRVARHERSWPIDANPCQK
jgi:hypothetical protein